MIEHRLIEQMIAIINRTLSLIDKEEKVDPVFIDIMVDFVQTYADRTHHGKEENILFKALKRKPLSPEDQQLMRNLIYEHAVGRKITKNIIAANRRYRNGDQQALATIGYGLRTLANFYPKHVEKEEKIFFPAVLRYFSEQEEHALLDAFGELDRKMIHEKYNDVVDALKMG